MLVQRSTFVAKMFAKQANQHVHRTACRPGPRASGASSTSQVNWDDDAITTVSSSRIRALGLRPKTVHLPYLISVFRTYSYPGRGQEACPRGKQVCSKAKLGTFFVAGRQFAPASTFKSGCWHREGGSSGKCLRLHVQFRLTTPGLSRRIIARNGRSE